MTATVFNGMAETYDPVISDSKNPVVIDFKEKERDFLDKVILDAPYSKVGLVEIGPGTGRLLLPYIDARVDDIGRRRLDKEELLKLKEKIAYIVGLDISDSMIKKTIKKLRGNKLIDRYQKDVFLVHGDAKSLSKELAKLDKYHLPDYPRIIFCMLCTLGNIPTPKRFDVLKAINEEMTPKDSFVVAVWNRKRFDDGIEMYHDHEDAIGHFTKRNVFRETAEIDTEKRYYIHWFSPKEIKEQLENSGFQIKNLEIPKDGPASEFCILIEAKKR